jgi:hypothetical protein
MRSIVTALGLLGLLLGTCVTVFFGILALTPTSPCTGGATTGSCAYGQLPFKLALFGPLLTLPVALLATFLRSHGKPRPGWLYAGLAAVVAELVIALQIAAD